LDKDSKKIPNIGLIVPTIDYYYEREMLSKLFFSLETRACNIHVFCGQSLPSDDPALNHGDLVSVLPKPGRLDGLIITTATFLNFAPLDSVLSMIGHYKDTPIVSISYPLENTYNIILKNQKGIQELTNHLIETHGFTDIIHIAGPKWSQEAKDRAKAFLYTLQQHGLLKDNKRIIRASFTRDTGKAAAQAMLKDYDKLPQAVVCCTDEVAFGFLQELEAHGIRVPDDIAVTGFDNVIWSRFSTPAITTAYQPLDAMMSQALTILLDLFDGKPCEPNYAFDTQLIVRESCSCHGIKRDIINIKRRLDDIDTLPFIREQTEEQTFRKNHAMILNALKTALVDPASSPNTAERFLGAIFEALIADFCHNGAPFQLAAAIERFYVWAHRPYYEDLEWKTLDLSIQAILRKLFPEEEKKVFLDHFCLQLVYELERIGTKIYTRDLLKQNDLFELSNRVIHNFSSVTSYAQIPLAFSANCELLNFKECYCCILETPTLMNTFYDFIEAKKITMVFGKSQKKFFEETAFTTDTMLPPELLTQGFGQSLAYFPLNTGNLYYGYFACDLDNMLKPLARTVRQQVSNILDRLDLLDKLEEDNKEIMRISLHDALTGLLNRRGFFEEGQHLLLESLEKKQELVLLFGDLDGLKTINDTYGHQSGDIALKSTAQCLRDALRDKDIVSRFGGDEFSMLLYGNDNIKNIKSILARIQKYFNQFNQLSTLPYDIHLSFGYATKNKAERKDLESMIEEADQRLYAEKNRRKAGGA